MDAALPELAVRNDHGCVWRAHILLPKLRSLSVALEETFRRTKGVAGRKTSIHVGVSKDTYERALG